MKIKVYSIYDNAKAEEKYPYSAYIIGIQKQGSTTYAFVIFEDGKIITIDMDNIVADWQDYEFGGMY